MSVDIMQFKGFDDMTIDFEDILKENGRELAQNIKKDAIAIWGANSKYPKGWTYEMKERGTSKAKCVVYNKTNSSLGGWLEFGHVVWNAKEKKRTSPQEHILNNYKKQKEKFIEQMEHAQIK